LLPLRNISDKVRHAHRVHTACMSSRWGIEKLEQVPRTNHEASVLNIQRLFGWVSDSAEFVKTIERHLAVRAGAAV
jgi:hypothetical protein